MKIICQACQSKYTIADDKIQGKVAKIRCRQCGATVIIDGSAAGGAQVETVSGAGAPAPGVWLVNVADGDQRSMSLHELVDAYRGGSVTAETYVWKDGFSDWLPIGQVQEVLDAARGGAPAPGAYQAPAGAARREAPRGRAGDLFQGGAKDDDVTTSAPAEPELAPPAPTATSKGIGPLGEESSNIFSLDALTSSAAAAPAPFVPTSSAMRGKEDSGVIDLNALAKAQAAKAAEPAAAAPAAPPQFFFPAALGQVQPPTPAFDIPEPAKRSSMPKIVAIGVAVAVGVVGVALFATHKEEPPPPPVTSITAPPPPPPEVPTTVASEELPKPEPSAEPAETATTGKKRVYHGGGRKKPPTTGGDTKTPVPTSTPKKGNCGCAAGDMACAIRCSATGH